MSTLEEQVTEHLTEAMRATIGAGPTLDEVLDIVEAAGRANGVEPVPSYRSSLALVVHGLARHGLCACCEAAAMMGGSAPPHGCVTPAGIAS